MTVSTSFTLTATPTFRDVLGRFAVAEKELLEAKRDEMRTLGRRAVVLLRAEAPKDTDKFAAWIRFRTFVRGETVGFTTSSLQPLGLWIVGGTKAHTIVPRGPGYPLRFEVGGKTVFSYRVRHPGTKPNPYPERATKRLEGESQQALARISLRYVAKVTGR